MKTLLLMIEFVLVLYALNLSRQSPAVLISVKIHVRWKHVKDTGIRKAGEATWGMKKRVETEKTAEEWRGMG